MAEKTIKVFLASSEELRIDRLEFGDLVNRLNNIYRHRGVYIELKKWESFDASIAAVRKQSDYNDIVRDSDMFLALFHTKAGKYTLEEFESALDEFNITKVKPKIYTYFKDLQDGQAEEAALVEFKKKLSEELGHYYCRYANPDTMMLHFVLQIKVLNLDVAPDVTVADSYISIDGEKVIDLKNIPFIYKNRDYVKMKQQLADVEGRYLTALERSRKYPEDPGFMTEVLELSEAKSALKKNLEELETNIVGFAEQLLKLSSRSVFSARLRKAQEFFEDGDIAGANIVLNFAEISEDIDHVAAVIDRNRALIAKAEASVEDGKKQLAIHVEELLVKAEAVQLDLTIADRYAEAKACYAKASEITEKYGLDGKAFTKYGHFARLQGDYREAERQYLVHHQTTKEKADQDPDAFLPELAQSQINLGVLYTRSGRWAEAEERFTAALGLYKALEEKKPGVHLPEVALSQNFLGSLYSKTGQLKEAEELYKAAAQTYSMLSEKNTDAYQAEAAETLHNIAILYDKIDSNKEAEEMYKLALDARRELEDKHPGAHLPYVAGILTNLGILYTKTGRIAEAEERYKAGLEIFQALADANPNAFLPYVAKDHTKLGTLYEGSGRYDEAIDQYLSALKISKALAAKDSKTYVPAVAECQYNLGALYATYGRMGEAEEIYTSAAQTYIELADKKPNEYLPDVVRTLKDLGVLCTNIGKMTKAKGIFELLLTTVKSLAENNPGKYLSDVAECQHNLGTVYGKTGQLTEAADLLATSIKTRKVLASENPSVYLPGLALTQYNLGIIYAMLEKPDQAAEMYRSSLDSYSILRDEYQMNVAAEISELEELLRK